MAVHATSAFQSSGGSIANRATNGQHTINAKTPAHLRPFARSRCGDARGPVWLADRDYWPRNSRSARVQLSYSLPPVPEMEM